MRTRQEFRPKRFGEELAKEIMNIASAQTPLQLTSNMLVKRAFVLPHLVEGASSIFCRRNVSHSSL